MKLKENEIVRSFEIKDIDGNLISIESLKGKKTLLSFSRYAGCPFCNLRISEIISNYPDFQKKGLQVFVFFESSKESILKYLSDLNMPFTVVPDPELTVYKIYDVESSWLGYLKGAMKIGKLYNAVFKKKFKPGKMENQIALIPADFLINSDLTIYKAYYGKDITDHLPVEKIKEFLNN